MDIRRSEPLGASIVMRLAAGAHAVQVLCCVFAGPDASVVGTTTPHQGELRRVFSGPGASGTPRHGHGCAVWRPSR
eukprot:732589-Prymnesium_polylepis.1